MTDVAAKDLTLRQEVLELEKQLERDMDPYSEPLIAEKRGQLVVGDLERGLPEFEPIELETESETESPPPYHDGKPAPKEKDEKEGSEEKEDKREKRKKHPSGSSCCPFTLLLRMFHQPRWRSCCCDHKRRHAMN